MSRVYYPLGRAEDMSEDEYCPACRIKAVPPPAIEFAYIACLCDFMLGLDIVLCEEHGNVLRKAIEMTKSMQKVVNATDN